MSVIRIEGMQFYAYHGCFLEVDVKDAAENDNLESTVNYQTVYLIIAKEMEQQSSLLEHVAYRILKRLQVSFPSVEKSWVSVQKINPPLGGKIEKVVVEMSSDEIE